jgi:hypothetical protein
VLLGWKTDHLDCQELHEYARCRTDLVSITEPNEKDQKNANTGRASSFSIGIHRLTGRNTNMIHFTNPE